MKKQVDAVMAIAADLVGIGPGARILEINEDTLRRRADRGLIPVALRLPDGTRLFQRSVLERIAAECKVQG